MGFAGRAADRLELGQLPHRVVLLADLDAVVALLRDSDATPLSILARLTSACRRLHATVDATIDWRAEYQSWYEECALESALNDYLAHLAA